MAGEREQRISSALHSLINEVIPGFEGESDDVVDERQANALELARSILERYEIISFPLSPHLANTVLTMHLLSPIAPAVEADGKGSYATYK